jgi:hypothetical protein
LEGEPAVGPLSVDLEMLALSSKYRPVVNFLNFADRKSEILKVGTPIGTSSLEKTWIALENQHLEGKVGSATGNLPMNCLIFPTLLQKNKTCKEMRPK